MFAWALRFIPLGFVRRFWKPLGVVLILGAAFVGGWKVNGWRLEEAYAAERLAAVQAAREEFERLQAEQRAAYEAQLAERDRVAEALSVSLVAVRTRASELRSEVDEARLSKPAPTEGTDSEVSCDSNPFGSNFVRLWNDAGRLRSDLSGADPSP